MSDVQHDHGWFATNLQHLGDMVVVIARDTTIVWGNDAVTRMLGWRIDQFVGHSFAEFVHPDDLHRASEVAAQVDLGAFEENAVTPSLYRVRDVDGRWVHLELNSTIRSSPEGEIIVVCRFTGDLFHGSRLLEAITSGASVQKQVDITIDLGSWRYPDEGYAVVHRTADGYRFATGPGVPAALMDLDHAGPTPWRTAMSTGEPVEVVDLNDPAGRGKAISDELAERALAAGYSGCLALGVPDEGFGEPAVIVVWSKNAGSLMSNQRYAVMTMVRCLTLVLQQQAQLLRLERAAYTDHLTGLCSRRRFLDLLDAPEANGPERVHAVLYVDLDGFKRVNDEYGHTVGDHVLSVAAARIAGVLPSGAVVGRLGGDEFGILCAEGTTQDDVSELAARIATVMAEPIAHAHGHTVVGASVGWHVGEAGTKASEVLDMADRALLVARTGRPANRPADG